MATYWKVVQVAEDEVHVYPLAEEPEHLLHDGLCKCWPEVREVEGGSMVVHKRLKPLPMGHANVISFHWIQ